MVLEERAASHGVPGFSIAVVDDLELQWTHHFGVVSDQEPVSVSETTLFAVGSLSKAVTAATVLSMVEDGLIELDLDINEQLESWQVPENDFTADEAVTPRRLLNHTGGVAFSPPASYPATACLRRCSSSTVSSPQGRRRWSSTGSREPISYTPMPASRFCGC